jgi:AcrR family transcriptional regulator
MKEAPRPSYNSPLRERQKADTRELILQTVEQLLKDRSLEQFSLADVARAAGITDRTLYRHFETREALLEATWARVNDAIGIRTFPASAEELVSLPLRVFPGFEQRAEVIRAMLTSPQGRELRLRVNEQRQAAIRSAVRQAKPTLREPALTRLCAAVQLLYSATSWATMRDYWGLDSAEAGRAASEAIATLLDMRTAQAPRTRAAATTRSTSAKDAKP